jgi:starvation-inducible DNA-binding protein
MENLNTLELNNLSSIGLDKKRSKELAKKLNILLATYSIFYQNTRGSHWNLKGEKFFELHIKFEDLYSNLFLKIDEIAERIVTIGYLANYNFSDYKVVSKIEESTQTGNSKKDAENVLNSLKTIISLQREILTFCNEIGDEGTYSLMSDNIKAQEKMVWMYSSFLEK